MELPHHTLAVIERVAALTGTGFGGPARRLCEQFPENVGHFLELGASFPEPALALLTLGTGKDFGHKVSEVLQEFGFEPALAAAVAALQRRIDDWMLLRLLARGDEVSEVAIYFRRQMDLEMSLELLAELSVGVSERAAFAELSAMLGASQVGLLGVLMNPPGRCAHTAYLHVHEGSSGGLAHRLSTAFQHVGLAEDRWRGWVDVMHPLGSKVTDVFVSSLMRAEICVPELRLEYFSLPVATADQALTCGGIMSPDCVSPLSVAELVGADTLEHLGLTFGSVKTNWNYYFTAPTGRRE